jgi:hypothetical protein
LYKRWLMVLAHTLVQAGRMESKHVSFHSFFLSILLDSGTSVWIMARSKYKIKIAKIASRVLLVGHGAS